jgi:hypothetical protein
MSTCKVSYAARLGRNPNEQAACRPRRSARARSSSPPAQPGHGPLGSTADDERNRRPGSALAARKSACCKARTGSEGEPPSTAGLATTALTEPLLHQHCAPTKQRPFPPRRLYCPLGSIGTTAASDAHPARHPLRGVTGYKARSSDDTSPQVAEPVLRVMLRTAQSLAPKGFRRWASTPDVSLRCRQAATEPSGNYPHRTSTGRRRRACQLQIN